MKVREQWFLSDSPTEDMHLNNVGLENPEHQGDKQLWAETPQKQA